MSLYSEVVQHDEFLNLSPMQVCKLISSDRLTVSSEETVGFFCIIFIAASYMIVRTAEELKFEYINDTKQDS